MKLMMKKSRGFENYGDATGRVADDGFASAAADDISYSRDVGLLQLSLTKSLYHPLGLSDTKHMPRRSRGEMRKRE